MRAESNQRSPAGSDPGDPSGAFHCTAFPTGGGAPTSAEGKRTRREACLGVLQVSAPPRYFAKLKHAGPPRGLANRVSTQSEGGVDEWMNEAVQGSGKEKAVCQGEGTGATSRHQPDESKQVAKGKKSIGGIYSKSDILFQEPQQISQLMQLEMLTIISLIID